MLRRYRREPVKTRDQFTEIVDRLEQGSWLSFARNNGEMAKFRLAWISPQRSRLIFTDRQGQDSFVFTADELAQALRNQKAGMVAMDSLMNRTMSALLDKW
jgi:hypothetical protein